MVSVAWCVFCQSIFAVRVVALGAHNNAHPSQCITVWMVLYYNIKWMDVHIF